MCNEDLTDRRAGCALYLHICEFAMAISLEDPVSLEMMWSRLINIAEECWITLWRTAFSLIIGEAQDFGCELLDANGDSLAHSARSMPVFNLTLPHAVRSLLEHFPPETLHDGDVLVTNDPWICAGHLFDLALATPVFRHGRLVGVVGSIAHCSDIGGSQDWRAAREIYDEGLQIPPLRLYRGGEPNDDLLRLIRRNVRKGDMVLGDIQAQLSANAVGAQRLLAFMDEYGLDDLAPLAATIQARSEHAMRRAIAAVPDGEYRHAVRFDGMGEPLTLPVHVVITGDEILVDWAGAPAQLERGAINCTLSYTAAHTAYALKCILSPETPANAGSYRPITVLAPEGSILNCRHPAAVNQRTMTGWYCAPAIFGALAQVLPQRVQAFTGLPLSIGAYGYDRDGRLYNDHLFQGGGQGASAHGDGKSALLYPTSAASTSVELFETRAPLLVKRKELLPDSGGAGRWRGGLGQIVGVRKLYADGNLALVGVQPQGTLTDQPGLHGGLAGTRAAAQLLNGERQVDGMALGGLTELRDPDQVLIFELAGGSGFGDPCERPVELVQRDLDEGYITRQSLTAYGCILDADGRVRR